jgi:hypothetical protein
VPAPPTQAPVVEETPVVPGVPVTGGHLPDQDVAAVAAAPKAPVSAPPVEQLAPMLFRVFYDRDLNSRFGRGEGIRGIAVYLLDANARTETAKLVTNRSGDGTVRLPLKPQRIYVPYLGISMPLNDFPRRELHSLWVPAVQLPDRVP